MNTQLSSKVRFCIAIVLTSLASLTMVDLLVPQSTSASQSTIVDIFKDVEIKVPKGEFSYGGSTSWAPIRLAIETEIQNSYPNFKLKFQPPIRKNPGSGTGIEMLLNGNLSFALSSRSLKESEFEVAKSKGFKLKEIPIALDGIAIAVHPSLKIPDLSVDDLKGIYSGTLTNWKELKGPDLRIMPYSRDQNAGGTVDFFVENVLGSGSKFGSNVITVENTTQGLQKVSEDPSGIYYASAPEVIPQCNIKPVVIRNSKGEPISPYVGSYVPPESCPAQRNQLNIEAIRDGSSYPITRRLFVIVKVDGGPAQAAGEAYAELLLTEKAQALIEELGFVRIR